MRLAGDMHPPGAVPGAHTKYHKAANDLCVGS